MTTRERYGYILGWFAENMGTPETELRYKTPYELLVSVILAAQCTDKRVNMITPALFKKYPTPFDMAKGEPEEIYEYIRSCTYPNSKARYLVETSRELVDRFGGAVPSDLEALKTLPGVGRKTANVVGAVLFNKSVMPVDTHVFRVSARLGLTTNAKTPLQAEMQLTKNIPPEILSTAHHWLILHGRYVCTARKPHCTECGLKTWCKYYKENVNGKN